MNWLTLEQMISKDSNSLTSLASSIRAVQFQDSQPSFLQGTGSKYIHVEAPGSSPNKPSAS